MDAPRGPEVAKSPPERALQSPPTSQGAGHETPKQEDKPKQEENASRKNECQNKQSIGSRRRNDFNSKDIGAGQVDSNIAHVKHERKRDKNVPYRERAKANQKVDESGKPNKQEKRDQGQTGNQSRRRHSGRRPTHEHRQDNVYSERTSQDGRSVRPKVRGTTRERSADHLSKPTVGESKSREKQVGLKSTPNPRPKTAEVQNPHSQDKKVGKAFKTPPSRHPKKPELHPKPGSGGSAPDVTSTHRRRHHHSGGQNEKSKSTLQGFQKSSKGDVKLEMEKVGRDQKPNNNQGRRRRSFDDRQFLYRVQLSHLPEVDAMQFHTVFANHPGFVQASVEYDKDGSKGFVYFSTYKSAENFSKSVRTVGLPERVNSVSVTRKQRFPVRKLETFEDKLVDLAGQLDSNGRRLCSGHNHKVEEIEKKVHDLRPSGRFVSMDEHNVRVQQRKVLQMKQEELAKQKEEFEQRIKTISEELISLSPDCTTRSKLLRLLGQRLGGIEKISTGCTPEVKSDCEKATCAPVRGQVQEGTETVVNDAVDVPETEAPITEAVTPPHINSSEESAVSLVDIAQDLVGDNETGAIMTGVPTAEEGTRPEVKTEQENHQSSPDDQNIATTRSPEEQTKVLKDLKSRYLRECSRFKAALPMYAHRSTLLQEVRLNSVIVVVAETGSGKSTQIVQYLADDIVEPGKLIACTQPRKIAAITLADRVAAEYGCSVGNEIGYAVGSKRRVGDRTKAVFMTDQALLNTCVKEGELDNYSCIIIDEAHERSIHTDLLLGILKKSLQTRPNLRLIIASATIDPTLFSNYFGGCPVMSVPGRTFPVDVIYKNPQLGDSNVDFVSETVNKAIEIHNTEAEGDILAFLTSPLDIERACERTVYLLGPRAKSVLVLPLHGKLQPEDQKKVFEPASAGTRKIVFATNIAETSVTIPGIIYVVDSGMIKERYFDAKRNLSVLDVKMVARSSAVQRAGRAGRIQPGKCYRLYTEEEFNEMRGSTPPEILRMHLGMAVLKLMELGVTDVTDFDFVERPSEDALCDAIHQLDILGAIDKTEHEISTKTSVPEKTEATVPTQPEKTTEATSNLVQASLRSAFGGLVDFWMSKMFSGKNKQTEEQAMKDETQEKSDMASTSIRLTELGKQMSQLPTEPRLSKMILEGVKQGCGKEALLIAALASAAGSVYFRAGTEEEKATADRQKMKFCHEGGDLLSMLDVHRDWVGQTANQRSKWCVANSINAKTMRLAEESFKEMKHQLALSGVNIPEEFAPIEAVNNLLPQLILGAYCNNLCVFSGHERAGYIVERLRQCVHIHPSSALRHLGAQPKWVVFDEILRTSRDFIINVTPVDVGWLGESASRYASKVNLRSLEQSTMVPCQIQGYGPEVVRGLIGRRAQILKSLEAAVSDDGRHLCVIEVDTDRCQVAVFTSQDRLKGGEKIVRDVMDAKHNDLKNESDEIPVVHHRGDGTRMVLGKGGEVQDVLTSSEFRCVDVFYTGEDTEGCEKVMDVFVDSDDILISTKFDKILIVANSRKVGTLTFSSFRAAQEAVNRYDRQVFRNGSLLLKPLNQSRGPGGGGPLQTELNVMWFRRECKGFGFVQCSDEIEARRLHADIHGKGIEGAPGVISANVDRKDASSLYIRGSSLGLNEQTLQRTVRRYSVIVPTRYSVVWKPPTAPVDTERDQARLEELFSEYISHGTLQVSVPKPKSENQVRGYAIVTMSDESEAQNAVKGLHNQASLMGTQNLSVERKLQCNVVCYTKIYDVLEESFRNTLEELTQDRARSVRIDTIRAKSGKTVYFKVSGNDVGEVARAKSRLHEVMRPDTVTHEDPAITSLLFTKLGLDFIQTVRNHVKGVHIDADRRTFSVSLYGKDEPRMEAKKLISEYLHSLTEHKPREIHLTGGSKPVGVMKDLLNRYGLHLDGLKDATGAKSIRLDMRKHLLVVRDSDETFNKVKDSVEECAKGILDRKGERCQREEEDDSEDCSICFCPIDGRDYRLQCCGHRYCHECIKLQLATAIRSQEFPITCGAEGCNREFFLKDLRLLLNQAEFQDLVKASLNAFVNKSGGRYRPCPSPDCPSVYRSVSEEEGEGQLFQCCMCHKRLCTRCHVDMHDGMSCKTWEIFKGDPDDTLREWMKEKKDVKLCPKCNWVIEKIAGCQHMTCRCGVHICWICQETFSSTGDCYGHLSSAHGGYM